LLFQTTSRFCFGFAPGKDIFSRKLGLFQNNGQIKWLNFAIFFVDIVLINLHSHFSLLYGVHSPEVLLQRLAEKGITQAALTDINNSSGMADWLRLAAQFGIHAAVGIDFRESHGPYRRQRFLALAKNNEGLSQINALLSEQLCQGHGIPKRPTNLDQAHIVYPLREMPERIDLAENEWIGVRAKDLALLPHSAWKRSPKLVILAGGDFHCREDHHLHRLLRAIDANELHSRLPADCLADPEENLGSQSELCHAFRHYPELILNTREVLANCQVDLAFGKNKNRKRFGNNAREDFRLLYSQSYAGLHQRYNPANTCTVERLEKELHMIESLGFTCYFLIAWDMIRFAKEQGFFHVGRGSGANSLAAYCLGITDVDPIELDLYFERFINPHRANPPDFDLDFSWKDRDTILDYLFQKYPQGHTALIATYQTFQERRALRELAKVFGLPESDWENTLNTGLQDPIHRAIRHFGARLKDMPAHLSIHAGGVLISEKPLSYYSALQLPPKGYPMVQFSMLEAEDLGLYKFDVLSQRGLGHIRDAIEIIQAQQNTTVPIRNLEQLKADPKVQTLIKTGNTMGCFYVESPAMRMLLQKLKAKTYTDLVAASSIIRPGVARSGMMRAYIERFHQPDSVEYIHPLMENLLKETFGIMVYQEDVIKVAHHFAGLSLAEADVLRRGMSGKFRSREEFARIRDRFFECSAQKGIPTHIAQTVWTQMESFAGYSFSKAHSASYAAESIQSLYLKAHYPLEFIVAVINNFGGFYRTEIYLHEARLAGAQIERPCIKHSHWLTRLEGRTLWLGFIHIKGLEEQTINRLIEERKGNGDFQSLADLRARTGIDPEPLDLLIRADALRCWNIGWKTLLWDAMALPRQNKGAQPLLFEPTEPANLMPKLHYGPKDRALQDIELFGFTVDSLFALAPPPPFSPITAPQFPKHLGQEIQTEGYLVTVKPTRTAQGDRMFFGTFIDRQGGIIDTVHFPPVAARYPFRGSGTYLLQGRISEDFSVPQLEVTHMEKPGWETQ
jgi:DNA polymerase-3 subunit alpha